MKETEKDTQGQDNPEQDSLGQDSVVIQDRSGRRQFIRAGTAFLLASGTAAHVPTALGADCDRVPDEKTPKQAGNGSDSDEGTEADAAGCGRDRDKPKITRYRQPGETVLPVKVIKANT